MRTSSKLLIILAIACSLAWPGAAIADNDWNIRFNGVWTDPDGQKRIVDEDGEVIRTSADSAFGLGLSIEYSFSDRLGLEVGYLGAAESDFDVSLTDPSGVSIAFSDGLGFSMIDASLNIRLTSGERTKLYVAPVIAQIYYDDLRFEVLGDVVRIGVDDDFGFGALLGVDIALGDGAWFFSGRIKYVDSQLDAKDKDDPSDPGVKIDFNPLMVGVGFGLRF